MIVLKEDIFDYEGYLKILEDLVRSGFRMSDEVYLEAVRCLANHKITQIFTRE